MDKLIEFGRRAMFYVRVLSGYEERRIRSYRLQLERRLQQAQARKQALRKIPEQVILAEVRRMVEEMQNLNKKLEETEAAIEEYFKPIDKEAEILMKMQLDGEEKTMEDMMVTLSKQALLEQAEAEKRANSNQSMKEMMATMQKQALLEKAEVEKPANSNQSVTSDDNQDPASTDTQKHAQMR